MNVSDWAADQTTFNTIRLQKHIGPRLSLGVQDVRNLPRGEAIAALIAATNEPRSGNQRAGL